MKEIFMVKKGFQVVNLNLLEEHMSNESFKKLLGFYLKVKKLINFKELTFKHCLHKFKKSVKIKYSYFYRCFVLNCKNEFSSKRDITLHLMKHVIYIFLF
jgi:hypothetical protein